MFKVVEFDLKEIGAGGKSTNAPTEPTLGALIKSLVVDTALDGDDSGTSLTPSNFLKRDLVDGKAADSGMTVSGIASGDEVLTVLRLRGVNKTTPVFDGITAVPEKEYDVTSNTLTLPDIDTSGDLLLVAWIDTSNIS